MRLYTYSQLQSDIRDNLWKIPADVDLVVGIPRSGMLVASYVALARNLPLVDLDGFLAGRIFESGTTRRIGGGRTEIRRALVIDDSSRTGEAMRRALRQLDSRQKKIPSVTTCVVYGTAAVRSEIDVVMVETKGPRIFEWNVLQHPNVLANACLDIDGVLCHDPRPFENDDGEAYRSFLANARPLHIPTHHVHALVTSRLERYREETENWMSRHGVSYDRLVMSDHKTALERRASGSHAQGKANYYRDSDATLFIESELGQAEEIARLSGKPVLSLEGPVMCMPGALSVRALKQKSTNRRLLASSLRRVIGDRATEWLRARYMLVKYRSARKGSST